MEDIYIENISIVSLIAGLKMEGTVKWRGLKSQGPLYVLFLACLVKLLLYSGTCLLRPLPWDYLVLKDQIFLTKDACTFSMYIYIYLNLSSKTTYLKRRHFMANKVVFQDGFYSICTNFIHNSQVFTKCNFKLQQSLECLAGYNFHF